MTDKSNILKTFNAHFFEFLDDIVRIFPENTDIATARKSFETIKKANPTIILKVWHKHVYSQYKEVIDQGKVEFFFEKDYGDDLGAVSGGKDVMRIIDTLREPLRSMNDANKQHTAKYLLNLSKLSSLYV
jgi:hypothetical protein